jgi:hypothetical protein
MPTSPVDPSMQAPQIIQKVEEALPIDLIFPTHALVFGAAVLVGIVFLHAFAMRWVLARVASQEPKLRSAPAEWRVDLVMITVVFGLLAAALLEVVAWTAALKYAGLFPTWASAASYAATTYTTLGDVTRAPPPTWRMMGPIIAISGLFTFGWSGSVLVDVVGRLGRVRDLARAAQGRPSAPGGASSTP